MLPSVTKPSMPILTRVRTPREVDRMAYTTAARLGGIGGILFVVLFFRSYLTPPDSPVPTSGPKDVVAYFSDRQDGILLYNGLLLIFAAFFFLWFLGALHGVLRSVEGGGISSVALAGGLVFITLVLAGAAVEIVYPATLARFENFQADAQLGFLSLALSGWMYRFALAGMSVLIAAASMVVLATGVMPRWVALVGFLAALLALLRFLIPLGGIVGLVWVLVVSALMLGGRAGRSRGGPTRPGGVA
jgi:hypothetical protein